MPREPAKSTLTQCPWPPAAQAGPWPVPFLLYPPPGAGGHGPPRGGLWASHTWESGGARGLGVGRTSETPGGQVVYVPGHTGTRTYTHCACCTCHIREYADTWAALFVHAPPRHVYVDTHTTHAAHITREHACARPRALTPGLQQSAEILQKAKRVQCLSGRCQELPSQSRASPELPRDPVSTALGL